MPNPFELGQNFEINLKGFHDKPFHALREFLENSNGADSTQVRVLLISDDDGEELQRIKIIDNGKGIGDIPACMRVGAGGGDNVHHHFGTGLKAAAYFLGGADSDTFITTVSRCNDGDRIAYAVRFGAHLTRTISRSEKDPLSYAVAQWKAEINTDDWVRVHLDAGDDLATILGPGKDGKSLFNSEEDILNEFPKVTADDFRSDGTGTTIHIAFIDVADLDFDAEGELTSGGFKNAYEGLWRQRANIHIKRRTCRTYCIAKKMQDLFEAGWLAAMDNFDVVCARYFLPEQILLELQASIIEHGIQPQSFPLKKYMAILVGAPSDDEPDAGNSIQLRDVTRDCAHPFLDAVSRGMTPSPFHLTTDLGDQNRFAFARFVWTSKENPCLRDSREYGMFIYNGNRCFSVPNPTLFAPDHGYADTVDVLRTVGKESITGVTDNLKKLMTTSDWATSELAASCDEFDEILKEYCKQVLIYDRGGPMGALRDHHGFGRGRSLWNALSLRGLIIVVIINTGWIRPASLDKSKLDLDGTALERWIKDAALKWAACNLPDDVRQLWDKARDFYRGRNKRPREAGGNESDGPGVTPVADPLMPTGSPAPAPAPSPGSFPEPEAGATPAQAAGAHALRSAGAEPSGDAGDATSPSIPSDPSRIKWRAERNGKSKTSFLRQALVRAAERIAAFDNNLDIRYMVSFVDTLEQFEDKLICIKFPNEAVGDGYIILAFKKGNARRSVTLYCMRIASGEAVNSSFPDTYTGGKDYVLFQYNTSAVLGDTDMADLSDAPMDDE